MMTLLAPMISKRRKDRSPIFVVAPSRCFPPVEGCRGTRPSVTPNACARARRRKIAGLAEGLRERREDRDRRGDQRPDAWHRHQSSGHVILLGSAGDPGVELPHLCLQMGENRDQHLPRGDGIDMQNIVRVLDDGAQFRCVGRPLWHNLAELGQMSARHAKGVRLRTTR